MHLSLHIFFPFYHIFPTKKHISFLLMSLSLHIFILPYSQWTWRRETKRRKLDPFRVGLESPLLKSLKCSSISECVSSFVFCVRVSFVLGLGTLRQGGWEQGWLVTGKQEKSRGKRKRWTGNHCKSVCLRNNKTRKGNVIDRCELSVWWLRFLLARVVVAKPSTLFLYHFFKSSLIALRYITMQVFCFVPLFHH